jgi:hypothetical protein
MFVGLEPPVAEEFGFVFFLGNAVDGGFVEPGREGLRLDVAAETVFVFGIYEIFDCLCGCGHNQDKNCPLKHLRTRRAVVKPPKAGIDTFVLARKLRSVILFL